MNNVTTRTIPRVENTNDDLTRSSLFTSDRFGKFC